MALLGKAALAMWWDVAPEMRADFEDWHSHEHFPERLAIPGFLRASRWASATGGEDFFVLYELAAYDTLSSPGYLARLNAPTPWSTRMMPHHRNMVRSQCRVLESRGGGVARHALTVRLAPAAGRDDELRAALRSLIGERFARPGIVGMHLLQHETPAIALTIEQRIRGAADGAAHWVFVVVAYELAALEELVRTRLGHGVLPGVDADRGAVADLHALSYSAIPGDPG